jgi:peptidoglycan/LPS O-acetylase OafA/YrhL
MHLNSVQSTTLHLIRFFCGQAVLVAHLISLFDWHYRTLISMASYAVLLFFILSGFLITHSVQQRLKTQPEYGFSAYFRDRFFRIYPPFLAALFLTFALDLISFEFTNQLYSLKQYFINLGVNIFLLQEFPPAVFVNEHYMIEFFRFRYLGTNVPLWTIGIEWWIYLFFGFGLFYILRSNRIRLWQIAALCFLALSPLYYVFVSVRMDSGLTLFWFLGLLIALASKGATIHSKNTAGLFTGLLLVAAGMTLFPKIGYTNSALLFALGLTLFIRSSSGSQINIPVFFKTSQFLSGYSYSLYLIHYPVILFMMTIFPSELNGYYFFLIYFAVNIIAIGFARLFEKNTSKLKQAYENYRSHTYRLQK